MQINRTYSDAESGRRRTRRRLGVLALAVFYTLLAFVAVFFRSLGLTYVRRRVTWRGRQIALRAGEKT